MDSLSDDLACKLIDSGVKRGFLVALFMDKSIEMFLSILAVHKVGGGYVPLDPEFPAEHIKTILSLAQIEMVLTTNKMQDHIHFMLEEFPVSLKTVDYQALSTGIRPNISIKQSDISHVLFTSDSTGVPKGMAEVVFLCSSLDFSMLRRDFDPGICS